MSTPTVPRTEGTAGSPDGREDVLRWAGARTALEQTQDEVVALGASPAVSSFRNQLSLLEKRLVADPRSFRDMFVASCPPGSSTGCGTCCCAATRSAPC